jgi:hypothetical protein
MGRTAGALGYLTFVLGIIMFIFAVMGMQFFGSYYIGIAEQKFFLFLFCKTTHKFLFFFLFVISVCVYE